MTSSEEVEEYRYFQKSDLNDIMDKINRYVRESDYNIEIVSHTVLKDQLSPTSLIHFVIIKLTPKFKGTF